MRAKTKRNDLGLIEVKVTGAADVMEATQVFGREIEGSFPDGNYDVDVQTVIVFRERPTSPESQALAAGREDV